LLIEVPDDWLQSAQVKQCKQSSNKWKFQM
jgi:hypothetical protein